MDKNMIFEIEMSVKKQKSQRENENNELMKMRKNG